MDDPILSLQQQVDKVSQGYSDFISKARPVDSLAFCHDFLWINERNGPAFHYVFLSLNVQLLVFKPFIMEMSLHPPQTILALNQDSYILVLTSSHLEIKVCRYFEAIGGGRGENPPPFSLFLSV